MFEGIGGALLLAIMDYLYIFVVLGGLALLMVIVGKIVQNYSTKKVAKETKITPQVISATPVKEKEEFDGKLIAVITAAVVSYLEKPKSEFKIVNIKKYKPAVIAPWTVIGREELMLGKNIKY
jgi:Na+-transporting methylmalonyl-CoA/oxaloacetate decarboxylase gamma subunit